MDAHDQDGPITEGWQALALFTDRHEQTLRFAAYLNDDPPPGRVLYLHGDGGYGKSLLILHLHDVFCRRLPEDVWRAYRSADTDLGLASWLDAQNATPVARAYLDFGAQPRGEDRPLEPLSGLMSLRRQLAGQKFAFPLFDFACVWYLHRTRQLSRERIKEMFPEDEVGFLTEVIDAVTDTPYAALAKGVLKLIGKRSGITGRVGRAYLLYTQKRGLKEEDVQHIQRLRPERELSDHLPTVFAADLNANVARAAGPDRVALFLDTHDAFWQEGRTSTDGGFFERDEWVRRLVGGLDAAGGVVAVVAGREPPRWASAPRHPVAANRVELIHVAHLDERDADQFLLRAGIADEPMRAALTRYASDGPGRVHPFYLGLCADTALTAARSGRPLDPAEFDATPDLVQRERELLHRFLRYVDREVSYAVASLSSCRAFDRGVYALLAERLNFSNTEPAFGAITRFSFVWRLGERGQGWFRVHTLLRRLIRKSPDESDLQRRADAVLEEHYRRAAATGDPAAVGEAIYHAGRQDEARGATEWVVVFRRSLDDGQYQTCRVLLDVLGELDIPAGVQQGDVLEAKGAYMAAITRHDDARATLEEALAAYEAVGASAVVGQGRTARRLGDLETRLARYEKAFEWYEKAISTLESVTRHGPTKDGLLELSAAYRGRGSLQAATSKYDAADASFRQAVALAEEALKSAADDPSVLVVLGNARRSLGDAASRLSRHADAERHYTDAATALDRAVALAPALSWVHDHRANALRNLAGLLARLDRVGEALAAYDRAVAACDAATAGSPDFISTRTHKANATRSRAGLLARLGKSEDAEKAYRAALAICDEVLRTAPASVPAFAVKSNTLSGLGQLLHDVAAKDQSRDCYRDAIAAADQALTLAPDSAAAGMYKARALQRLAVLDAERGSHPEEVLDTFRQALAACDESLAVSPDYVFALNVRGETLLAHGDYLRGIDRPADAARSWQDARPVLSRSLTLAPGDRRIQGLLREVETRLSATA